MLSVLYIKGIKQIQIVMNGIKGFNNKLQCHGFQYEIGKTYEQKGKIKVCEKGFHFISEKISPLAVFLYYPLIGERGKLSRYCEVEAEGKIDTYRTKTACSKITIGAEIGIPEIVKAQVEWVKKNTTSKKKKYNTENCSFATNTGDYSVVTNTGDQSAAINTGNCSAAITTGYQSVACAEGKDSVAMATGYESKAKGALGCAIVVVERGDWNGETYPLKAICSAIVDGVNIKADTWYTVKNGKFVEVGD